MNKCESCSKQLEEGQIRYCKSCDDNRSGFTGEPQGSPADLEKQTILLSTIISSGI